MATHAAGQSCARVRCSGHGECFEEGAEAYCLCEPGYTAVGQACRRTAAGRLVSAGPDAAARIVMIGRAEEGHERAEVGAARGDLAPGPLSSWVPLGGLWCSDFVSWVYRAAGASFTGGYAGGWLLPTNAMIRRWYEQRRTWVAASDPAFTPSPGDYVRIRTSEWGHSAIVSHVEGSTLHTIEGNASGRVHLVRYLHYRTHERVDGFGMTTSVEARRAALGRTATR